MSQVSFGSLKEGDTFTYNGQEYTKTKKIRISCCKFVNAQSTGLDKNKLGIKDNENVEVKE